MQKVAKLAGVSTATVSRVLNDADVVKDETASRVLKAVAELGYALPDRVRSRQQARASRARRRRAPVQRIGLVTLGQTYNAWVTAPAIGAFVSGLIGRARSHDIDVMIEEMPRVGDTCRMLDSREVGGLIILVTGESSEQPTWVKTIEQMAASMPVVWGMGAHIPEIPIDHVMPDNFGIGHLAAQHLAGRGCKRVVAATLTPSWVVCRHRVTAFTSFALARGMEVETLLISTDPQAAWGYPGKVNTVPTVEAAYEWLLGHDAVDGVFAARDQDAIQLQASLRHADATRQQALAFVACDNVLLHASPLTDSVATMDLNVAEICRLALGRLRHRMADPSIPPIAVGVHATLVPPRQAAGDGSSQSAG